MVSAAKAVRGGAASSVASKAASVGSAVGGAVRSGATRGGSNIQRSTVLKPLSAAMKKVKPLKLVRGLLKSPSFSTHTRELFSHIKMWKSWWRRRQPVNIDEAELNQKVGTRLIKAVTGVIGGAGGAMLGGAIGSAVPVAGNIVGAIVGGVLGDVGGRLIGGLIADKLGDKTSTLRRTGIKIKNV